MFDYTNWDTLPEQQKEIRVAEGYKRLVRLYQNNKPQTDLVVRLANQALIAGLQAATQTSAAHSPVRMEPYGPGVLQPVEKNSHGLTTVRFWTADDHSVRAEVSYAVRGGALVLPAKGEEDRRAVYLDINRSRATITVTVQPNKKGDGLEVIGKPTYDVRLVQSPIQRPYPLPRAAHLFTPDANPAHLYEDLQNFAEQEGLTAVGPALAALRLVGRVATADMNEAGVEREAFGDMQKIYDRHLRAGASKPFALLSKAVQKAEPLRKLMPEIEKQTSQIFDEAVEEILSQVEKRYLPPEWQEPLQLAPGAARGAYIAWLRREGPEGAKVADFMDHVGVFQRNPRRSLEDAEALYLSVFENPDSDRAADAPGVFNPKVKDSMRDRIAAVHALRKQCKQAAAPLLRELVRVTAKHVLPRFTAMLRAESAPVDFY